KDLAIWIKALSEGKLFNQKYFEIWKHAFKPVDPNNHYIEYGYGMFLRIRNADLSDPIYYHLGHLPGYNSYMIYDPIKKITIIVSTNLAMTVDGHMPADSISQIGLNEFMLGNEN